MSANDVIKALQDGIRQLGKDHPDLETRANKIANRMVDAQTQILQKIMGKVMADIKKQNPDMKPNEVTREAMERIKNTTKIARQGSGLRVMEGTTVPIGVELANQQVFGMLGILLENYAECKETRLKSKKPGYDYEAKLDAVEKDKKAHAEDRVALAIRNLVRTAHESLGNDPAYQAFFNALHNAPNKIVRDAIVKGRAITPSVSVKPNTPPPIPGRLNNTEVKLSSLPSSPSSLIEEMRAKQQKRMEETKLAPPPIPPRFNK